MGELLTHVALPAVLAFIALTAALLSVPLGPRIWATACVVACASALAGGIVDLRGLIAIGALAALCVWARCETRLPWAIAANASMLALCAAFFVHVLPGFSNPRVVDADVLSAGSLPYTKYLNFDKGVAGLFLLGLVVTVWPPARIARDRRATTAVTLCGLALLVGIVMMLSLALGYVRWDPKLPSWTSLWLWSMVFLTALPEEALFRGVVQSAIERWFDDRGYATPAAVVVAGLLFGVAHASGGPVYVLLASVAGIGYGWIYASTRSIVWAIAAHAGLNTVHFMLFTYPALNR
jgi:membrane protease YdiL (CAAX protease family)